MMARHLNISFKILILSQYKYKLCIKEGRSEFVTVYVTVFRYIVPIFTASAAFNLPFYGCKVGSVKRTVPVILCIFPLLFLSAIRTAPKNRPVLFFFQRNTIRTKKFTANCNKYTSRVLPYNHNTIQRARYKNHYRTVRTCSSVGDIF